ncbi:cytidyltransferase [bacterium 336/3]|nr:cytidyltransferase [bacterium 336/3]
MNILVTICARGGSKGIPHKNIKKIANKPLIAYSINTAYNFAKYINQQGFHLDVALSTDDIEIKKTADHFGLKTEYLRPEYLATDSASKIETIEHLLEYHENVNNKKYDYTLDLDVSSPLRTLEDLKEAFGLILNDDKAVNIFSVSNAHKSPYFNMVEKKENGYYHLVSVPSQNIYTRQSSPIVYEMNASFYFYKQDFFINKYKSAITDKSLIYLMKHQCFDLDTIEDFEYMSFLIENNKLNFAI